MKRLNNLGLCSRARGLISGEEMVYEAIKAKKVYYVFLASDASENTKKKIIDRGNTYGVYCDLSFSGHELSHAIGKENRMVVGITNQGFVKILKKLGDENGEKE